MKHYYYYSYSFADAIGPELIMRIVKKPIQSINGFKRKSEGKKNRRNKPHFMALGSIFHDVRNGDVIWGTGVNPKWQKKLPPGFELDIRAVRGPLTREYIINELGLECADIYGDPALLFPKYFKEFQASPVKDYTVIAQHNDEEFIRKNWDHFGAYNIFLCQRPKRVPWRQVINKILSSRFIISSSLHGLIFAEIYGIPARWWNNEELPSFRTEGRFKFNDYYASTGRSLNDFAVSIDEALEMGGKEHIQKFDTEKLNRAFPYELFHSRFWYKIITNFKNK